jgi:hypothetical protein
MIIDKLRTFFDGEAITAAVNSPSLDLGEDAGTGCPLFIHAQVVEDFAGGTSLTLTLQDSADNSTFSDVVSSPAVALASLKVGYRFGFGSVPKELKRYLRLKAAPAGTMTGGKITAFINLDN